MVGGSFKSVSGVGIEMFRSESRTSNSARVDSEMEGTSGESIGGGLVELPALQVVRDCGKNEKHQHTWDGFVLESMREVIFYV